MRALKRALGGIILGLCLLASALSCSGGDGEPAAGSIPPPPPFRHQSFYDQLLAAAEGFTQQDGDWLEDYGDADFYGLAFYAYVSAAPGSESRVQQARARALALIDGADFFNDDVQEIMMSALGLIGYLDATGARDDLPAIDELLDRIDALVGAIGYYLQPDAIDSWALDTYGSTAISAMLGLLNAEYALRVGGPRAADRLAWAVEMERRIGEAAFDGTSYRLGPGREGLYLYPNVAMAILEARLFQLTGAARYRDQAVACYRAIAPLRLEQSPARYRSPYSAAYMGAQTDDYSTLSSHNYLMLALALLYQATGDTSYVDELDSVLDGLAGELLGSWCLSDVHQQPCTPACQGQVCVADSCTADRCGDGVLHHFIDGRIALPSDAEFFCSGCNLQLLYVLRYRREL